jgi:hypothetical protein
MASRNRAAPPLPNSPANRVFPHRQRYASNPRHSPRNHGGYRTETGPKVKIRSDGGGDCALAVDRRAPGGWAGLMIGLAVAAAILVIGPLTGASLNPASTFGPMLVTAIGGGDASWGDFPAYVAGPLIGAVVATLSYDAVARPRAFDVPEPGPGRGGRHRGAARPGGRAGRGPGGTGNRRRHHREAPVGTRPCRPWRRKSREWPADRKPSDFDTRSAWPSACTRAGELCTVVREPADDRPELLPSLLVGQTVVLVEPLPRAVDEE